MRVLIVEGQTIVLRGLAALITAKTGWVVVGTASTGRQALALAADLKPDVCVTGLMLEELNGIDLARRIKEGFPQMKVVLLTRFADTRTYERALAADVDAYLLKRDGFHYLMEAVQAVTKGRKYVSPNVAHACLGHCNGRKGGAHPLPELSLREREIVQLLAEGRLAKEIAQEMALSVKTVESHRRRVMEKVRAVTVSDLTRFAIREGLVRLDGVSGQASEPNPEENTPFSEDH